GGQSRRTLPVLRQQYGLPQCVRNPSAPGEGLLVGCRARPDAGVRAAGRGGLTVRGRDRPLPAPAGLKGSAASLDPPDLNDPANEVDSKGAVSEQGGSH